MRLGRPGEYLCVLGARDALTPLAVLNIMDLQWGRVRDDISEAKATVSSKDAYLSKVDPWNTELWIFRDRERVWSGPVVSDEEDGSKYVINAYDLLITTKRRVLPDMEFLAEDGSVVFKRVLDEAITPAEYEDQQWLFEFSMAEAYVDMKVDALDFTLAFDKIDDLGRSAVDYTVVDRKVIVGKPRHDAVATLDDSAWATSPRSERDGLLMENRSYVKGVAEGEFDIYAVVDEFASQGRYPLLAGVLSESDAYSALTIEAAGARRLSTRSFPYPRITGGTLSSDAPITMDRLVPGHVVRLALTDRRLPVVGDYVIDAVKVNYDPEKGEKIELDLSPVGIGED